MRIVLVLALATTACADSIAPDRPDAGALDSDATGPTGPYRTSPNADGSFTTILDATSMTAWVHVDLDSDALVDAAAPWDLRFQRFQISTNGGTSGDGGVEVARLDGVVFADVTSAPTSGVAPTSPRATRASTSSITLSTATTRSRPARGMTSSRGFSTRLGRISLAISVGRKPNTPVTTTPTTKPLNVGPGAMR